MPKPNLKDIIAIIFIIIMVTLKYFHLDGGLSEITVLATGLYFGHRASPPSAVA